VVKVADKVSRRVATSDARAVNDPSSDCQGTKYPLILPIGGRLAIIGMVAAQISKLLLQYPEYLQP
jgi:hypothetical protein